MCTHSSGSVLRWRVAWAEHEERNGLLMLAFLVLSALAPVLQHGHSSSSGANASTKVSGVVIVLLRGRPVPPPVEQPTLEAVAEGQWPARLPPRRVITVIHVLSLDHSLEGIKQFTFHIISPCRSS